MGPATDTLETLCPIILAGVDVIRINASHAGPDGIRELVEMVRTCAKDIGRPVAILLDLPGPKIRTGEFTRPARLRPGDKISMRPGREKGDEKIFSVDFLPIFQELQAGDPVLLADGSVELKVISNSVNQVDTIVVRGGVLRSHKGVNCPTVKLEGSAFTGRDREAARAGVETGVRLFALSFVSSATDIATAREFFAELGVNPFLVSKIERGTAIENLDEIIDASDGIMVARGDLAVETGLEGVGLLQKRIIGQSVSATKPVITATQMMESMVDAPRPTRAEVTDVTNAVMDGTSAVMLSEETAVGKFPSEVIGFMDRICKQVEAGRLIKPRLNPLLHTRSLHRTIVSLAATAAMEQPVSAIIAPTASGNTARQISAFHLPVPVIAPVTNKAVAEQLTLSFGVKPVLIKERLSTDSQTRSFIHERPEIPAGIIVMASTSPLGPDQPEFSLRLYEKA